MKEKIAAIILAAGKGKRMKSDKANKVVSLLEGKPMILRTVEKLRELSIDPIIVVVGFAKESVMKVLGRSVIFANQLRRLGTAHALSCGFKKLPKGMETVIVLGGDDSAFYTKDILKSLIESHEREKAALTFLTINVDNPFGLGRVIRDNNGRIIEIAEEKDATENQKRINEINPECYVFKISFLRKNLKKVKKSPVTGEYYLTSLIDIAIKNKEKLIAVNGGKILWHGVNTLEDLKEADKLFSNLK
jgi:bifunctional UDP-N-acetylglucosamine pyrophosphorylase / glucosamine-1-phosphate N-acetyltransferase